MLDAFQAGLSWAIILNKREGFRDAFDGFDPERIARYTSRTVKQLLKNSDIVRNRQKVEATLGNARAFLAVRDEQSSFDRFIWDFVGGAPIQNRWRSMAEVPAQTAQHLVQRWAQGVHEDRRFHGTPDQQREKRDPRNARLEIAPGGPVEQHEGRLHHHAISSAVTKPPRRDRNGSVYSDAMVDHTATTSKRTGRSKKTRFDNIAATPSPCHAKSTIARCQDGTQAMGALRSAKAPRHSTGTKVMNDSNISHSLAWQAPSIPTDRTSARRFTLRQSAQSLP